MRKLPVSLVLLLAAARIATAAETSTPTRISGPYTHQNLSIFLIHSAAAGTSSKVYLPLKEAMEQHKVVVHETGNVNRLAIENVSATDDVLIQGGDIVKGGQQDRTFVTDLILPPKSGRVPIPAFCVEKGRWSQRGNEAAGAFNASTMSLASKDLKLAVKGKQAQTEVWRNVDKAQADLAKSAPAAGSTGRLASPTSMQLWLESAPVSQASEPYVKALGGVADGKPDVLGYAVAINGELNGADVYSSPGLFRSVWPKMLLAAAVEAVSRQSAPKASSQVDEQAIQKLLAAGQSARESSESINRRTRWVTRDDEKTVLYESRDAASGDAWVHRNYLVK